MDCKSFQVSCASGLGIRGISLRVPGEPKLCVSPTFDNKQILRTIIALEMTEANCLALNPKAWWGPGLAEP